MIQGRLRDYIVENRLKAGDRLPTEDTLRQSLAVSRSAIREALRGLEALGIVEARHGAGRVVLPLSFQPVLERLAYGMAYDSETILQISEVRQALDVHFIRKAIANLTADDMARLAALVREMETGTQAGRDVSPQDHAFHELLYRRAGNPLALQLFEIAWQVRLAAFDQNAMPTPNADTAREHRAILGAIEQRDAEQASVLLLAHYANFEERLRQAVQAASGDETNGDRQAAA